MTALLSCLVASVAGATSVARAAVPLVRDPTQAAWIRVDTANFTLFGDVPEARLRAIAAKVEAFRSALEALHPGSTPSPRETAIYLFADAARGLPFTPRATAGEGHLGVNAAYDVGNFVTVAAPMDDLPLEPLFHAYAHQFLDDGFPRLPLLVTEGLAGFYTGFGSVPEGTLVGLVNADHVRWAREHTGWSLNAQLGLDAATLRTAPAMERRTFVAASWSLMHYLVSGSGSRRAGVPAFLEALQSSTPPDAAARAAFGIGLDDLQEAVQQYVQANRFQAIRIADPGVKPDPTEFRARRLQRDEVLAALGDLIVHGGTAHDADAEGYFGEALRVNPRQARAYAGLGSLHYARNRFAEAIPPLRKAVEIDADALSCYLLARSILKTNAGATGAGATSAGPTPSGQTAPPGAPPAAPMSPPWLTEARLLLARATTLRPGFAAPYVTLGATHIRPDGDARSGILVLEKARALLPARIDIAGNLVYLYLRIGDLAHAQAMTERVIAVSGDAEALRTARAAIATYKEDVAARRDAEWKRETPAEEARRRADARQMADQLRKTLASTKDPVERARLQKVIARAEEESRSDVPDPISVYNQAIAFANQRDYARAIALLEALLSRDLGADMSQQVGTTLERLRQDAARYQQGAP